MDYANPDTPVLTIFRRSAPLVETLLAAIAAIVSISPDIGGSMDFIRAKAAVSADIVTAETNRGEIVVRIAG
jgi:hypothetical protein